MIVEYDGPRVMHANALFKARMKITLEESIRPGGRIAVAARHTSDFGDVQMDDSEYTCGSVRATAASAGLRRFG